MLLIGCQLMLHLVQIQQTAELINRKTLNKEILFAASKKLLALSYVLLFTNTTC